MAAEVCLLPQCILPRFWEPCDSWALREATPGHYSQSKTESYTKLLFIFLLLALAYCMHVLLESTGSEGHSLAPSPGSAPLYWGDQKSYLGSLWFSFLIGKMGAFTTPPS